MSLVGGFSVTAVAERLMTDIERVLVNFDERAGGLVAVVLLMKTGLPVTARIRAPVEETFLSASLASLLGIALDLSDRLFTMTPDRVILDTEAGSLVLHDVNDDMSLVAIFKKQHLGAMILLVEQTAKELAGLFQST